MTIDAKWTSRKFLVCVGVLAIATLFRMGDLLDGVQWTNIAMTCVGAYNLSNAVTARR